jgi:hypothetical protein
METTRFDETRTATYTQELPLSRLAPGDHLVTLTATQGTHRQTAQIRIRVQ